MNECYIGDVRDGLRHWIAQGVRAQTCVTSPPYWGLRDYGTAQWDGGDAGCDHRRPLGGAGAASAKQVTSAGTQGYQFRDDCGKCGARRIDRQIGLEPTFTEYVQTMVEVFRLVRDVLADDGTLWLNLGDSYASTGEIGRHDGYNPTGNSSKPFGARQYRSKSANSEIRTEPAIAASDRGNTGIVSRESSGRNPARSPLKPKDLCGIPWRVAFALQADGWYLRSDIIWHKPNPMPESVTDRPTKAHEYLFLLAKSERYFYDAAAIAEQASGRSSGKHTPDKTGAGAGFEVRSGFAKVGDVEWQERNRRTVWSIATEPYADAHFAVMPTALVEPCVLAGSTVGDVVLDPFMGSGTVAQVAQSLGRRWIGCELNASYVEMQATRAKQFGFAL